MNKGPKEKCLHQAKKSHLRKKEGWGEERDVIYLNCGECCTLDSLEETSLT